VDFAPTEEQRQLRQRCRELAADFATHAAEHDRAASHPSENHERLRREGFLALNLPSEWGGSGVGLLGHTLAFEALAAGCPSTALAFNMHAPVVMPVMASPEVEVDAKRRLADLVVGQQKLIVGNFSEPGTTALLGDRPLAARARRVDGGWRVSGRKMFASMLEAADYCMVMAYPETARAPGPRSSCWCRAAPQAGGSRPTGTPSACGRRAATR
jgi:alkylation response protein AidB-like acyl-CoA dehydrogenase